MHADEQPLRPIEDIYAELVRHPDFAVGNVLFRSHIEERFGVDFEDVKPYLEDVDLDGISNELYDIASEAIAELERPSPGTDSPGFDF